ncbi:MAG: CBS domain-containing protein, partial [Desulfobacterales bacterium]|nr:CBS domain-containing protein [Desulfobacterales bacterium]
KDLFMHQVSSNSEIDIRIIMRKPYFVPENNKLDKLLKQFKKRKDHMAIVIDEYGGVSGLITLEDALEEIVGEITDETDKEESNIVKLKKREWLVLGKTDIDEVNAAIGMNIPETNEYGTFSGYILNRIGRIPEEKEEIDIDPFVVIVEQKEGNRIQKYIIRRK